MQLWGASHAINASSTPWSWQALQLQTLVKIIFSWVGGFGCCQPLGIKARTLSNLRDSSVRDWSTGKKVEWSWLVTNYGTASGHAVWTKGSLPSDPESASTFQKLWDDAVHLELEAIEQSEERWTLHPVVAFWLWGCEDQEGWAAQLNWQRKFKNTPWERAGFQDLKSQKGQHSGRCQKSKSKESKLARSRCCLFYLFYCMCVFLHLFSRCFLILVCLLSNFCLTCCLFLTLNRLSLKDFYKTEASLHYENPSWQPKRLPLCCFNNCLGQVASVGFRPFDSFLQQQVAFASCSFLWVGDMEDTARTGDVGRVVARREREREGADLLGIS